MSPARQPPLEPASESKLHIALVLFKAVVMAGACLALFVTAFVGYLTLPAIVLFAFAAIYGSAEYLGRRARWRRRVRA